MGSAFFCRAELTTKQRQPRGEDLWNWWKLAVAQERQINEHLSKMTSLLYPDCWFSYPGISQLSNEICERKRSSKLIRSRWACRCSWRSEQKSESGVMWVPSHSSVALLVALLVALKILRDSEIQSLCSLCTARACCTSLLHELQVWNPGASHV